MDFANRQVVVTGGTGALGHAVVARLIAAGAHCHVPAIDRDEAARFAHTGAEQVTVLAGVDLADEAAVARYYAELPGLWASIHLAGGFDMAPIVETGAADFVRLVTMNATTCFLCCREAVKRLRAAGGGRIVNVAARPALEPRLGAGMVAYTMSKAAVAALTQALAQEVVGDGILVNAVAPSILDTPANRAAMPKADFAKWPSTAAVAETIVQLASPANTVARGAVVPVYGQA